LVEALDDSDFEEDIMKRNEKMEKLLVDIDNEDQEFNSMPKIIYSSR
jgi:hypothetical protein